MSNTVALIDYGAGNLQSVRNALKAAGADNVLVTARPEDVLAADRTPIGSRRELNEIVPKLGRLDRGVGVGRLREHGEQKGGEGSQDDGF